MMEQFLFHNGCKMKQHLKWSEASILITGGTGSFGKRFVGMMLQEYGPKKIIVFSRDELKQHEMRVGGFDHPSLRYFIGDVRDAERLRRALHGVDVVIHAAALKQVPACEYNPIEAVMTNVMGARNVIEAALDAGVQKVMAISTDKAVSPVNLYGATKLVAEKLFVQGNAYSGGGPTRFACVRYGNVVGSRGSVVPLFLEQRKTGRVSVTDPRMTRFWITLEQGVRFVIRCTEMMRGGEVFVPKLPSMRMTDLVHLLAPDAELDVIGIRPGEKLHEALVSQDEARHAREFENYFVIEPAQATWGFETWSEGNTLPNDFSYTSLNNPQWLSAQEMAAMIE